MLSYKSQFEALSNRVKGLSEPHKLSCFLSRQKDEIRLSVRMLAYKTLNTAFGLAKIQEEYLKSSQKGLKSVQDNGKSSILEVPRLEKKKKSREKITGSRAEAHLCSNGGMKEEGSLL